MENSATTPESIANESGSAAFTSSSYVPFEIVIARSQGGVSNTGLTTWQTDAASLAKALAQPTIGLKDGSYFIRCNGSKRKDKDVSEEASVLILDGDSRIDENGAILSGAPDPAKVHAILANLGVCHFIYSSHSNAATQAELDAKNIDSGGLYDCDYYKYRLIIGPCRYKREQLPALLDYLFSQLHQAGVMLADVKENRTWSQPWYFPRVPDERRLNLFRFYQFDGNSLDVEAIFNEWLHNRPLSRPPELIIQELSSVPDGKRSPIEEFNALYSVEEILTRNDYKNCGRDRFLRPGSQSGIPGVVLLRNSRGATDRIYSHSNDCLNDEFAHDAFDCYRLLECAGDRDKALGWSPSISKHNQRVYVREQSLATAGDGPFYAPILSGTDARDGTATTRPLTEHGNASRLLDAYGGSIRYVPEAKAWLLWKNGAWCWDVDGAAIRVLAADLPRQIYQEGSAYLADSELFAKWARSSQKECTIESAVSLLKIFEPVRLPLKSVDADPFLIGLNNSRLVLDLQTGTVRPAQQEDFITNTLNIEALGVAKKAVRWLSFLDQVFERDAELINWLKRWCGYLLTGSTNEQFFLFCYGLGANGKSVFAELIRYLLGDYARAIAAETISESRRQAGGATPDLADLIGARLALSSETEDGTALAESLIKSIVAGDTITARKLYSAPVQFTPQFKLMILGNHKPIIRGTDHGMWRRVWLVPFNRTIPPEERDPKLLDKLKAEAPDILAWMAEGCLEWQERSLSDVPAAIRRATGEYREEQDLIGNWLTESCVLSPNHETLAETLYSHYRSWAIDNGLRPITKVSLGRKLKERGFRSRKSGCTVWLGIGIDLAAGLPAFDVDEVI